VVFDDARGSGGGAARNGSVTMNRRIRVHVLAAVNPGAIPRAIVDDHNVIAPAQVRVSPSPGTEVCADGDAESQTDRAANHKAGPRGEIDDARIVSGDDYKRWIGGLNFDVTRRAGDDDLSVGTEIAEIFGFLAHALDGVHHLGTLREDGVAEVVRPVGIGGHLVEDRWEGEKRA